MVYCLKYRFITSLHNHTPGVVCPSWNMSSIFKKWCDTYIFVPKDISDHVPSLSDYLADLHAKCGVHLLCKLQCPGLCNLEVNIFQTKHRFLCAVFNTGCACQNRALTSLYIHQTWKDRQVFFYSESIKNLYELSECTMYLHRSAIKWSVDSNSIWNTIVILVFYDSI